MFSKIKNLIRKISPVVTFKIIDVSGDSKRENSTITYQVCGKSTVLTETVSEIRRNFFQMKGFSKTDSDLVFELDYLERSRHVFKIKSILFDQDTVKFEIEDLSADCFFYLSAEDIILADSVLEGFSQRDSVAIYHQFLIDSKEKNSVEKKIDCMNLKLKENVIFLNNRRGLR